ncbi:MAG TPA: hypothetical protein VF170_08440, partial [Planctomycetaceae bacterium]
LLGGWVWWKNLPTPEWHLAEAERLIAEGDYSTARVEHLQPLLRENGDWPERAQELIDESRRRERENAPDRPRRRTRATTDGPVTANVEPVRPSETEAARLLRRAATYRDLGDVAAAVRTLEAFLAVTDGSGETLAAERDQARAMLAGLREAPDVADARAELIRSALARAEALRPTDAGGADAIYRGLLTLYGDDPRMAELLTPAREALEETQAEE